MYLPLSPYQPCESRDGLSAEYCRNYLAAEFSSRRLSFIVSCCIPRFLSIWGGIWDGHFPARASPLIGDQTPPVCLVAPTIERRIVIRTSTGGFGGGGGGGGPPAPSRGFTSLAPLRAAALRISGRPEPLARQDRRLSACVSPVYFSAYRNPMARKLTRPTGAPADASI